MVSSILVNDVAPLVFSLAKENILDFVVGDIERSNGERLADKAASELSFDSLLPLEDPFRITASTYYDRERILERAQQFISSSAVEIQKRLARLDVEVSDVKKAVDQIVKRRNFKSFVYDSIRRHVDAGIEAEASREQIALHAKRRFNVFVYEALRAAVSEGATENAVRLLMSLTVICTPGGTLPERAVFMRQALNGYIHGFPHVLKRVYRDELATVVLPFSEIVADISGHERELSSIYPAATLVQAISDYVHGPSYMETHVDPERAPGEQHRTAFERLPKYVQPKHLLLPKAEALRSMRVRGYKFVEGASCGIAMLSLIELLLTQVKIVLAVSGGKSLRLYEVVDRLERESSVLSPQTSVALKILTPRYDLGMRDMLSHGAFLFRDHEKLRGAVAAVSKALKLLLVDIGKLAPVERNKVYSGLQGTVQLADSTRFFVLELAKTPLDVSLDISAVGESEQAMDLLAEDKANLYRACWMLWGESTQRTADVVRLCFYGLHCSVAVLESLLRSVCYFGGGSLIRLTAEEVSVKCGFPMLDESQGNLLDPDNVLAVFGNDKNWSTALNCVKNIRNVIIHGRWKDLVGVEFQCFELCLKVMYTLARSVSVSQAATGPAGKPVSEGQVQM